MSLNLYLLRLFDAVARHGSFSRAAEALHISQPAVSRGVREFEKQVGTRLLERGHDGVIPTEAGRILLRHATRLFAAERAAEEELAALRGLSEGSLCLGASTTIATWYLPPLLAEFRRSYPAIRLQLRTANTSGIVDLLLARDLDIALVEGPVAHPAIRVRPWCEDRLVWIAASDHALAQAAAPLPLACLADELLIVREPGSGTRDVGRARLLAHGVTPREVLEVGGTEAIKQIVAAGLGIALVSEAAIRPQLPLGHLVILEVAGFQAARPLTRLDLPDRLPTPAATAFDRLLDRSARADEALCQ